MNILAGPLLLLAILGAEDGPAPKMPLGKDTTYFTGPLDKEGYVDYQAALNERLGKGITPETNANVLLWKAFGPAPNRKRMPGEYFKMLGLEEPPTEGDYLIDLFRYFKEHAKLDPSGIAARQLSEACRGPWKGKDYPHVAGWLAINEKPLAVIIEAVKRPAYFNPLVTERSDDEPRPLIFVWNSSFSSCREATRMLTARAMLHLGEGRHDEAWQDLLACHRLGRHLSHGTTVVEALTGIAIDGIANSADLVYLAHTNPMPIQARLKDLQALPPIAPVAEKIDLAERILFLDALQLVRRGKKSAEQFSLDTFANAEKPNAAFARALDRVDWTPHLQKANQWYDRSVEAMRLEGRAARAAELAKIEQELAKIAEELRKQEEKETDLTKFARSLIDAAALRKPHPDKIVNALFQWNLPSAGPAQIAYDRAEQTQRNLHVALALSAYRHDHDLYPAKLDDLVPKYLAAVPNDLFAEKPLTYLPAEKGYLLYSVGINGIDEGGKTYGDAPKSDDLIVRMPLPEPKRE